MITVVSLAANSFILAMDFFLNAASGVGREADACGDDQKSDRRCDRCRHRPDTPHLLVLKFFKGYANKSRAKKRNSKPGRRISFPLVSCLSKSSHSCWRY